MRQKTTLKIINGKQGEFETQSNKLYEEGWTHNGDIHPVATNEGVVFYQQFMKIEEVHE